LVFPEIDYTRVDKIKGMNITIPQRPTTTKKGASCSSCSACLSGVRRAIPNGSNKPDGEVEKEAEV